MEVCLAMNNINVLAFRSKDMTFQLITHLYIVKVNFWVGRVL